MTDKKNTIIGGIRRDLGLTSSEELSEAYVALPKTYSLPTELLSKKTKSFHEDLYQKYTQTLTQVSAELDTVNKKTNPRRYGELKWEEIYNLNAVHLHELYFANISDMQSDITMDSLAYMRLSRDFGTFDSWQYDFMACGQGLGNGWIVCGYSTFLQRFVNFFVESHNANIPVGCYPVIAIDVWEHAYNRDYGNDRLTYISAMMKELNWRVIEERFKRAEKIWEAIR